LKKISKIIALLLVLTLACAAPFFAFAEPEDEATDDENQTATEESAVDASITFPNPTRSMNIGERSVISYNLNGASSGTRVEWASSNPEVASVDDSGEVSANSVGVVEISASVPVLGLKTSTMIQVNEIKATALKIDVREYSEEDMLLDIHDLEVDKVLHLTTVIEPENVTTEPNITWESNAPDVLAVDSNGTVTALKEGDATITARAGDLKDRIKFNVVPPPGSAIEKYLLIGFAALLLLIIVFLIIIISRVSKRRRREREMTETRAVAAGELKSKITKQKAKENQRDIYDGYMEGAADRRTMVFTHPITECDITDSDISAPDILAEFPETEFALGLSTSEVDGEINGDGYEDGPDRPLSIDDID
jgi:hypothetical protein